MRVAGTHSVLLWRVAVADGTLFYYMNNIDIYIGSIHDRLVKLALRKARNLQCLLLPYLSDATASRIDWREVVYLPVELRSVEDKDLQADIVFKLPLGGWWRSLWGARTQVGS